jgi:Flp pilus assembly protein, protease CpaA
MAGFLHRYKKINNIKKAGKTHEKVRNQKNVPELDGKEKKRSFKQPGCFGNRGRGRHDYHCTRRGRHCFPATNHVVYFEYRHARPRHRNHKPFQLSRLMAALVQLFCFSAVLLYASIIDIKTHTVPNRIYILLLITALIQVSVSSLEGLLMTFVPLLVTGLLLPNQIGGGDIKFGALCGLILTGTNGLIALITGLLLCLLIVPVICKLLHKPLKGMEIPMIPFFSAGCILVFIINI